jgi:hypothetical protein
MNENFKKEMSKVEIPKTTKYNWGLLGSIVLPLLFWLVSCARFGDVEDFIFALVVVAIGCIIFGLLKKNRMKSYNLRCDKMRKKHQKEVDIFNQQTDKIKEIIVKITNEFKAKQVALRGIYEHVSGDPNAF